MDGSLAYQYLMAFAELVGEGDIGAIDFRGASQAEAIQRFSDVHEQIFPEGSFEERLRTRVVTNRLKK